MQFFVAALALGLLATPWVSAVVYQDSDSVVIDDSQENIELDPAEVVTTTENPNEPSCTNSNGAGGSCLKFQQCFPYAHPEEEHFDSFQLYDILKEVAPAEPCAEHPGTVCCPNAVPNLPRRKPQLEGMTTGKPSTAKPSTVKPTTAPVSNSTAGDAARAQSCGSNNYQESRVVGGREAAKHEFPYMVALINNGRQFCGGSLISNEWVLTAAHCIANLKSFSSVRVYFGDHDVGQSNEVKHESRSVKRGLYNKLFSWNNLQHDVALLQLSQPVQYTSTTIQPVCMSDKAPPFGEKAVLSGWGKTGKNKPPSPKLRTVTMKIKTYQECKADYASEPQAPPITTGMVCAGEGSQGRPDLRDACNGDSGGPLVVIENGKAIQYGIVSWGIGCGDKPGVYTRVDQYRSWIDKNSRRSKP